MGSPDDVRQEPTLEVSFAEDGRTVFVWRDQGDGTALLSTFELGAVPGTQRSKPILIEGV